ncbi:heavy metal-associated domain-containing protein [Ferrovum sp.]|uniref:heavy-metal-associated domain-containing protein n=1 Tax=Ferrovum sp. TaxID=2609467 RepID=UPI002639FB26|nr:heavy metal-associated domain-containing protein [Ferrovum sp.]
MNNLPSGELNLIVTGMTCQGCVGTVRRVVGAVPGVEDLTIDLDSGAVRVRGAVDAEAVMAAVRNAGYDVCRV